MKLVDLKKYVIRFFHENSWQTFFKLAGDHREQHEVFYQLLTKQHLNSVCLIDMEGIDYVATTSTHEIVAASLTFSKNNQIPVVFINAAGETLEGLKSASSISSQDRKLWVVDAKGNQEVLGYIPGRMSQILAFVQQKQFISASEIPELQGHKTTKTSIGNASVYLQQMFQLGLLLREKVSGSEHGGGSRGWTYVYRLPTTNLG